MSFWKTLLNAGNVVGTRTSMHDALVRNLRRVGGGTSFEERLVAISEALDLRYRVIHGRNHNIAARIESAPLAYLSSDRVPDVIAEYVVAQEHTDQAQLWVKGVVIHAVDQFFDDKSSKMYPHQISVWTYLDLHSLPVLWASWISATLSEKIRARGRELEAIRWGRT